MYFNFAAQEQTTLYADCISLSFTPLQNSSLRRFGHVTSPQGGGCVLTLGGFGEQAGRHMRVSEMVALDTVSMETQIVYPDQDNKQVEGQLLRKNLGDHLLNSQFCLSYRLICIKLL